MSNRNDGIRRVRSPFLVALCAAAIVCLAAASGARAAADEKGSVAGTVTTDAGKPATSLVLKLEQDIPKTAGRNSKRGGNKDEGGVRTVAKATTDAQGKFTMPNVPVGVYRLVGGSKNVGWIYMEVTVEPNKETKLEELKLAKT